MISNLSYVTPSVGRISIGEKVEKSDGKRLPRKLNHFRITALHKRDGDWVEHPITQHIAKATKQDPEKITEIPVKVIFNDPDLTLRERYEASREGRMVCASNDGRNAMQFRNGALEKVTCPGADHCKFGRENNCKLMVRANFKIDVTTEGTPLKLDELSTFIFRSRGYNSARALNRRLNYYRALFDGRLLGVPFILKLRTKSSKMSMDTPFFFTDLQLAVPLVEAARLAKETEADMLALGLNQNRLEEEARKGIANGPFEDGIEEMAELEEFMADEDYPGPELTEPVFAESFIPQAAAEIPVHTETEISEQVAQPAKRAPSQAIQKLNEMAKERPQVTNQRASLPSGLERVRNAIESLPTRRKPATSETVPA